MNKKAFSLVELIVWITISIILMVSVWVLISGWIANITRQEKVIKESSNYREFLKNAFSVFSSVSKKFDPIITSSWVLLKTNQIYDNIWFSFIWVEKKDSYYCSWAWVDSTITNHLEIKHFLPFEEVWEDIFSDFSKTLYSNSNGFKAFYKNNIITDSSLNIIIWKKWIFWDKIWEYWTWTLLNSPTGIAYDSTHKLLFISDTWNDRILVYNNDSSSPDYKKIYKLLDSKDWLDEPTWLAFYNRVLYIANSWAWKIFAYHSKSSANKKMNLNFKINKNINNLKNVKIEVFDNIDSITKPDSTSQFSFSWITKKSSDYLTWSNNKLTYWFSDFWDNFETQNNKHCFSNYTKYYESWWDIIKEEIQDCSWWPFWTWTLKKYRSLYFQNISSGTNIWISTIVNFDWNDFTQTWAYYVKLTLSWASDSYKNYFPFFINWDNDFFTRKDNSLEVISKDFKYPTWLKIVSWKLKVVDFLDRKVYKMDLDWTHKTQVSILNWFNFSKIPFDKTKDFILDLPIKNISANYDNTKKYFSLKVDYYKKYNCYNLDDKIKRTLIFTKNFEK